MRVAFLCKRRYMSKDVILDRYARLYEIPRQLARRGHQVHGWCLAYAGDADGSWKHEAPPGSLRWESRSVHGVRLARLASYPFRLLRRLRAFAPDLVIGASDIPHVVLGAWLARRLGVPFAADLYDNFEGFGQARIPGFVPALRRAVRAAALVTTTSEPLRRLVLEKYGTQGDTLAMPSSVDLDVFCPGDRAEARKVLGLPPDASLIGTAGGLYREKGVEPLYQAWEAIQRERPDVHLVLAGPIEAGCPPPHGERVHLLGNLPHAQVAQLFRAIDVGIISILDTPFGRYCFPQKAYEMLACGLPVIAADIGAMSDLFAKTPSLLFTPGDASALARAVLRQLDAPVPPDVPIADWVELVSEAAVRMEALVDAQSG